MEAKMERIETNVVKFEVKVAAKEFQAALNKSYNKNAKNFNIPGFRKGKVPMAIVKQQYGIEVLLEDAVNFAIDASYPQLLNENKINPVDYPQIEVITAEEGKDFVYTAQITVYPEVKLGEYKGLKIERPSYEVTEEDVNAKLKETQEKSSRVEVKEDGIIENGNIAIIDFKGFVDGVAFDGGEGSDYSLEIGSGSFIDTFETQLVGAKSGDNVEVNVTFPESYGKDELNGKDAKFEVTIKEVKSKELPELDDEFAKEVSEFDTLAQMKEDIVKTMTEENAAKVKNEYEDAVINAVVENATIEVPTIMIEKEIDIMVKNLETRLSQQGLTLEQYFQFTGTDAVKMREYMKENAERKVRTDLVLEAVEVAEKIEVSEEEIKVKAEEVAKMYAADDASMVDLLIKNQRVALEVDIKTGKSIDFLLENNKQ
ncbi:trigger factor [Clostridium gasigenes]|uniref:trigger factor n=1 Tax=Clostridium gasigenes TaxID=94869 RepID=UPI001627651F|nr:trigger factor [Clostridium gasigenes]MBB6622768.1 trigger factor [Clostridium gasigenes]